MIPTLRVFETQSAARDAAEALGKANFSKRTVLSAPADGAGPDGAPAHDIEAELARAYDDGLVAGHQIPFCRRHMQAGRAVVAVAASFGFAREAEILLEKHGALEGEIPPKQMRDDPSPFSDTFGLPVLSDPTPSTALISSKWTFSSLFGMGLLSKKAAPLSSALGMNTVIDRKGPRGTTLSQNAAPLSSALGMKTVVERKGPRATRLLNHPAPFSAALGIPALTKKQ